MDVETNTLRNFLSRFCDKSLPQSKQDKYIQALHAINLRQSRVLIIELDDLIQYLKDDVGVRHPISPIPRPIDTPCLSHFRRTSCTAWLKMPNAMSTYLMESQLRCSNKWIQLPPNVWTFSMNFKGNENIRWQ
tara:strand:+ start:284 stop:682 length:399 start_codon:yes stop_codon:yes gene_type:complete